ncbi:DNA cytosine methyltransferase [Eubacteriales bacterium OttesenSCG-928-A19]|nr:DNA cytosine methyltransferase [Eubacteriales bacterium OttesenSCG-928-A19]
MSTTLTLGSLFDGIGGFPLAGLKAGIQPIWASEIEPFPIRVTTRRLPGMRHLGDIHAIHGGKIEPVNIITFGSPCQNLSVAGKRSGLGGEQSSLFFEAVRIISEMREATHGEYPRWAVWENVPGALSSSAGEDFRLVLESLLRVKDPEAAVPMPDGRWLPAGEALGDGYSLAWRVLDAAQGWGVAQRRKRIFAVVDFDGECAGQILFESEGLSGYSPPGAKARQGAAGDFEGGAGAAGGIVLNDQGGQRMDVNREVAPTLRAEAHHHLPCVVEASGFCTEHSANSRGVGYEEERSPTLRAGTVPGIAIEYQPTDSRIKLKEDGICQTLCGRMGTGGNQVPLTLKIRSGCEGGGKGALIQNNLSATLACNNDQTLFAPKVYGIGSDQSRGMLSDNPHSGIYEADTSRTLDCNGGNPSCNQGGMAIVEAVDADDNAVYAMTTGSFTQVDREVTPPIMARDYKDPPLVGGVDYLIRRLTTGECCRLQGYPDGWCEGLETENPTDEEVAWWQEVFETQRVALGKSTKPRTVNQIRKWLQSPRTDAAEYKAYGNSVAVPCVHFVLAGIVWAQGLCDEKLS